MLLPIIANTFSVSIDALFGKEPPKTDDISADEALASACENLKRIIAATICANRTDAKSFDEQLQEYNQAMKSHKQLRSAIIRNHGVVYYRDEIGGLLLKKPKEGWLALFKDEAAAKIISLLGNRTFMQALYTIIKTGTNPFTLSSIRRASGITDSQALENALAKSGMFTTKTINVDEKDVIIYELTGSHRLFVLCAILLYAKEFAEFDDNFFVLHGTSDFFQ